MGVAIARLVPQTHCHDLQPGLFTALAFDGVRWRFPGLALAAREFPVASVDCSYRANANHEPAVAGNQPDGRLDRGFRVVRSSSWGINWSERDLG